MRARGMVGANWAIILRHLMRANLLLVSVTSVFHARHCVTASASNAFPSSINSEHTLRIRHSLATVYPDTSKLDPMSLNTASL